jgi:hemerythrin superfamily protein
MNSDNELTDIVDEILQDHRELEDYYAKIQGSPSTEESQKWFNQFLWEICHPVYYAGIQRGIQLATEPREDHRKLKVELEDLRKESDLAKFDAKFYAMFKDLMDHIKKEESNDLIYLKEQFSPEERKKAAISFDLRKKIAPTRPHPQVPDKPIALEVGLGLLAAPMISSEIYLSHSLRKWSNWGVIYICALLSCLYVICMRMEIYLKEIVFDYKLISIYCG